MIPTQLQSYIRQQLSSKLQLGHENVQSEWSAFIGNVHQYSPRVDVAVGPYSNMPGYTLEDRYNEMVESSEINEFLHKVHAFHMVNIDSMRIPEERMEILNVDFQRLIYKNQNARCLMAIEIENTSTKKHILGSLVNAASLGRVGIGIAYTESVKRTFVRILNYLAFLKRVEKNTYDTTNFLIVTKDQLISILL